MEGRRIMKSKCEEKAVRAEEGLQRGKKCFKRRMKQWKEKKTEIAGEQNHYKKLFVNALIQHSAPDAIILRHKPIKVG